MVKGLASATHEAFANPGLRAADPRGHRALGRLPRVRPRRGRPPRRRHPGGHGHRPVPRCGPRSTPTSPIPTGWAAAAGSATDLGGLYFNAIVAVAIIGRLVGHRLRRAAAGRGHPDPADGPAAHAAWSASTATTSSPTPPGSRTSSSGSNRPCCGLLPWRRTDPRGAAPQAVGPGRRHHLGAGDRAAAGLQPGRHGPDPAAGAGHGVGQRAEAARHAHHSVSAAGTSSTPPCGSSRSRASRCRCSASSTSCCAWSASSPPDCGRRPAGKALQRGHGPRRDRVPWWRASPGPGGPAPRRTGPVQPYERGTLADATTAVFPAASATG